MCYNEPETGKRYTSLSVWCRDERSTFSQMNTRGGNLDERIKKLALRYERVGGLTLASNVGVLVLFVERASDPDDVDRPMAPCERATAMPFLRATAAAVYLVSK